ncbi:MAG: DUF4150 domain-containing protein [Rhizobiaceae bacterium]
MGNSVYANKMGFFHKGSSGMGVAQLDVCLSPPPPPAGPVPIPYVNILQASDLIKGSRTVKIQGNPTALENVSEIVTSTGNEAATPGLGAGVVTHRIKGKGSFKLWSFDVKVEGKGVCRHGDPMGQNEMSQPPNCVDVQALVDFMVMLMSEGNFRPCDTHYSSGRCRPARSDAQADAVNGQPCWECSRDTEGPVTASYFGDPNRPKPSNPDVPGSAEYMTHDHQPPLNMAWELGGCWMEESPEAFKEHFAKPETVKPHCQAHACSQGGTMGHYVRNNMQHPSTF